jgi:hypothetical protein
VGRFTIKIQKDWAQPSEKMDPEDYYSNQRWSSKNDRNPIAEKSANQIAQASTGSHRKPKKNLTQPGVY